MGMVIETRSGPMAALLTTNSTTAGTSIADPADTLTNPVNPTTGVVATGVIRMGDGGAISPNGLKLVPFGAGTAANTFLMSVFAVERILGGPAGVLDSWTYHLLVTFTCTLCTKSGLANTAVNASQLYAGTITGTIGNANVDYKIISPTGNQAACVTVDTSGAELVKVLFVINASATSCNTLFGRI